MSPSPDLPPNSQPYTYTNPGDTGSLLASFTAISSNMNNGRPSSDGPIDSSQVASLMSENSAMATATNTRSPTSQSTTLITSTLPSPTQALTATSATAASSANPSSQTVSASSPSVTATTATANSASSSNSPSLLSSSSASTASSAANNTGNTLHEESSGGMSSPKMQAAVAVPVVVAVLAALALIFFCMRRRRRRSQQHEDVPEKATSAAVAARKRGWTRHLRIFSFDTELLMGGRYSSTNSIRSRQTGSLRSTARSNHSDSPSVHSVDEVAPPYRDAISASHPPNIGQVMAGAAGVGAADGVKRSVSTATAPPPYGAAAGRLTTPTSPTRSQRSNQNPFADSPPISPVEGSPFNDPPGTSPPVSRTSSVYRSVRDDASSIGGASDAASIRQATLARNASVMSGGRIIENVSRGSQ